MKPGSGGEERKARSRLCIRRAGDEVLVPERRKSGKELVCAERRRRRRRQK